VLISGSFRVISHLNLAHRYVSHISIKYERVLVHFVDLYCGQLTKLYCTIVFLFLLAKIIIFRVGLLMLIILCQDSPPNVMTSRPPFKCRLYSYAAFSQFLGSYILTFIPRPHPQPSSSFYPPNPTVMSDSSTADRLFAEANGKLSGASKAGFFSFGSKSEKYEEAADKFKDAG
jgi:hypothetical protein